MPGALFPVRAAAEAAADGKTACFAWLGDTPCTVANCAMLEDVGTLNTLLAPVLMFVLIACWVVAPMPDVAAGACRGLGPAPLPVLRCAGVALPAAGSLVLAAPLLLRRSLRRSCCTRFWTSCWEVGPGAGLAFVPALLP